MTEKSPNARLETFCDGVFAIAITLLILDIKIPPVNSIHSIHEFWQKIFEAWPSWFGFALSFTIILIDWNNHHEGAKLLDKSSPKFTFANGFLLFTVVILPFSTGLMAGYFNTPYAQPAISIYCFCLLLHSLAWLVIFKIILGPVPLTKNEAATKQVKDSFKLVALGTLFFLLMFILSFWFPYIAMILITSSWTVWLLVGVFLHPGNRQHLKAVAGA